jgi:hypothetical protein
MFQVFFCQIDPVSLTQFLFHAFNDFLAKNEQNCEKKETKVFEKHYGNLSYILSDLSSSHRSRDFWSKNILPTDSSAMVLTVLFTYRSVQS